MASFEEFLVNGQAELYCYGDTTVEDRESLPPVTTVNDLLRGEICGHGKQGSSLVKIKGNKREILFTFIRNWTRLKTYGNGTSVSLSTNNDITRLSMRGSTDELANAFKQLLETTVKEFKFFALPLSSDFKANLKEGPMTIQHSRNGLEAFWVTKRSVVLVYAAAKHGDLAKISIDDIGFEAEPDETLEPGRNDSIEETRSRISPSKPYIVKAPADAVEPLLTKIGSSISARDTCLKLPNGLLHLPLRPNLNLSFVKFILMPKVQMALDMLNLKIQVTHTNDHLQIDTANIPASSQGTENIEEILTTIIKDGCTDYIEKAVNLRPMTRPCKKSEEIQFSVFALDRGLAVSFDWTLHRITLAGCQKEETFNQVRDMIMSVMYVPTGDEVGRAAAAESKNTSGRKRVLSSSLEEGGENKVSHSSIKSPGYKPVTVTGATAIRDAMNDVSTGPKSLDITSAASAIKPNWLSNIKDPAKFTTKSGFLHVCVGSADITKLSVDVIVNAANSELLHTGGVAGAIAAAAGYSLVEESRKRIKREGRIRTSEVCITNAGYMPCKKVIHAVGPQWWDYNAVPAERPRVLKRTFMNCLNEATKNKFESIAIPAISGAIYGFPKDLVAQQAIEAIIEFDQSRANYPKVVYLVDIVPEMVAQFKAAASKKLRPFAEGSTKVSSASFSINRTRPHPDGSEHGEIHIKTKRAGSDISGSSMSFADAAKSGLSPTEFGEEALGMMDKEEKCLVCLEEISAGGEKLKCSHTFHKNCLEKWLAEKNVCPVCNEPQGYLIGTQPDGDMKWTYLVSDLPGFEYFKCGTIQITYYFPAGVQKPCHPHPGRSYNRTVRTAYLPCNEEGKQILWLLKKAFDQKLVFTIGRSVTLGMDDMVTWNDIHHKTRQTGGPTNFGYPDDKYLSRLREELASKNIKREKWGQMSKKKTDKPEDCWVCDAPLGSGMRQMCTHVVCGLCVQQYHLDSKNLCYRCRHTMGRSAPASWEAPNSLHSRNSYDLSSHASPNPPVVAGSSGSSVKGSTKDFSWLTTATVKCGMEFLTGGEKIYKIEICFSYIPLGYWPTSFSGFLPDSSEGRQALNHLKAAVKQNVLFRIHDDRQIKLNGITFPQSSFEVRDAKDPKLRSQLRALMEKLSSLGAKFGGVYSSTTV